MEVVITPTPLSAGRRRLVNTWTVNSAVFAVLIVLPVVAVLLLAFNPTENIWPHLFHTVLPKYVKNSLMLMTGVGIGVCVIGISSAWLVTMCHFPGRRYFEWLLVLPFAVPTYVLAYVYTDLLEYAGPVQGVLRSVFGWERSSDYWFPAIRSMGGAMTVMSLVLYPYVYLLARTAFLEQSPSTIDASRVLGYGAWRSFFKVSLPIARPAIAIGVALTLMETLNDFGTVDFFAVQTLTAGIYDVWLGMGNLGGAAQISAVMLLFIVMLVFAELSGRRQKRFYQSKDRFQQLSEYKLRGVSKWLAVGVCALPIVLGFCIPCFVLSTYAIEFWHESWTPEFRRFAANSVLLSATAAAATIVIAILLSYGRRIKNDKPSKIAHRLASLGYAMPGAVLAIGVIIPFARFDNTVDALMREYFGVSTGLILSGTVFAIIFAYVVRFLAISLGAVESSLEKISPNMDMAARTLGYAPLQVLRKFHIPLIRGGLTTAGLIVFVDCMKELPATLILRPFNFDTLATNVYQFASDELIEQAALGALAIMLCGLIPVIMMVRTISSTRKTRVV